LLLHLKHNFKAYTAVRSTLQLNTYALSLLVRIAGTSTALSIMKYDGLLWLPVILGLVVHVLTVPLLMFCLKGPLLGMRRFSNITASNPESYMHLMTEEDSDDIELSSTSSEAEHDTTSFDAKPTSLPGSAPVKSMQHFHRMLPHCLLPGAIIMFRDFGESYRSLLSYWMSRRFHWDLRDVGWVQLGETLFTSLIIALMPRFRQMFLPKNGDRRMCTAHGDSEDQELKSTSAGAANQDLALAQVCLGFSLIGSVLLSMSWFRPSACVALAVLAVSMGFPDSYNSFLAGKMDGEKGVDLQDIYMVLSIVAMVAARLGSSITSGIYSIALRLKGDSWATSMPIWVGAASFAVAWCISRRHRL
jgi:hypothetical protein